MTTDTVDVPDTSSRTLDAARVHIRPAQAHDMPALLAMIRALAAHEGFERYVSTDAEALHRDGFGERPRFAAYLAEIDGAAVGYVTYTVNYSIWAAGDVLAVDDLYVDPAVRGGGIGARLMNAVAAECLRERHAFVRWTVELSNAGAIAFYERLGAALHAKGVCTWTPERMDVALNG